MVDIDLLIDTEGLFETNLPTGDRFVFRLLSMREYRVFRGLRDSAVLEPMILASKVFERCYVGDADWIPGDLPAGVEISIGNLIMHMSGDCENDTLKGELIQAKNHYPADSVVEVMKQIVCTAFASLVPEDVDRWTRQKLIRQFVFAEAVLARRYPEYQGVDPNKIMSAEELARSKKKAPINFQSENAAIRKATGAWAKDDARKSQSLSKEQLAALKRKSPRG